MREEQASFPDGLVVIDIATRANATEPTRSLATERFLGLLTSIGEGDRHSKVTEDSPVSAAGIGELLAKVSTPRFGGGLHAHASRPLTCINPRTHGAQ